MSMSGSLSSVSTAVNVETHPKHVVPQRRARGPRSSYRAAQDEHARTPSPTTPRRRPPSWELSARLRSPSVGSILPQRRSAASQRLRSHPENIAGYGAHAQSQNRGHRFPASS